MIRAKTKRTGRVFKARAETVQAQLHCSQGSVRRHHCPWGHLGLVNIPKGGIGVDAANKSTAERRPTSACIEPATLPAVFLQVRSAIRRPGLRSEHKNLGNPDGLFPNIHPSS